MPLIFNQCIASLHNCEMWPQFKYVIYICNLAFQATLLHSKRDLRFELNYDFTSLWFINSGYINIHALKSKCVCSKIHLITILFGYYQIIKYIWFQYCYDLPQTLLRTNKLYPYLLIQSDEAQFLSLHGNIIILVS